MPKSRLMIQKAPKAFRKFKEKHNALVALLRAAEGRGGLKVIVTDGKMIIDAGSVAASGAAIDVVGSDGKLNKVPKHSTWATPTAYPTAAKVVNGSTSVLIDSTGVTITNGSGYTCTIAFASIARNMAIRTISVCDSGTTKSMDILASAPY